MPIIALSPMWDDDKQRGCMTHDYVTAVIHSGGAPVIMPFVNDEKTLTAALDACDALLLTGGADVDPACYGEKKLPCCGEIAPTRDAIDLILIRHAMEKGMPILGICRGMQILNCALGGTLYQDIETQFSPALKHPCYDIPRSDVHAMRYERGTLLHGIVGMEQSMVNSRHHQAVKALAADMRPTAWAPDGLLEGMEAANGAPIVAIQWHPEALEDRLPEQKRIFEWLMREASR